jgi:hypothetical protein
MKKNIVAAISLTVLLAATSGFSQSHKIRTKIAVEFSAAGTTFPAGQYDFVYDAGHRVVTVRGTDNALVAQVPIITWLAGAMHTTPKDSHVVFDKIGDKYFLSELWIAGMDGIDLLSTKEKHEHEIVNVPR